MYAVPMDLLSPNIMKGQNEMKVEILLAHYRGEMSTGDLAKKADVAKATINDIENKQVIPKIDTVCKIAAVLNIKLDDLVKFGNQIR